MGTWERNPRGVAGAASGCVTWLGGKSDPSVGSWSHEYASKMALLLRADCRLADGTGNEYDAFANPTVRTTSRHPTTSNRLNCC